MQIHTSSTQCFNHYKQCKRFKVEQLLTQTDYGENSHQHNLQTQLHSRAITKVERMYVQIKFETEATKSFNVQQNNHGCTRIVHLILYTDHRDFLSYEMESVKPKPSGAPR